MTYPLPEPRSIPGVTWRPAIKDDAAAIVVLQDACFEADGGFREVESEILERWESDYCNVTDDSLIAVKDDGRIIATSWSYIPTIAATKWRAFADNFVHPEWRTSEIQEFVHAWWEARCLQRLAVFDDGLDQWLWRGVYDWQTDAIDFLVEHGYEPMRYYDELIRDLSKPIDARPFDPALRVETWESAPLEDSLTAHNGSFIDHWGSQPIAETSWAQGVNEFTLMDASFVVYDGSEPVAYLMAAAFPHDFKDKGRTEAWVEGLGTIRSHRKRGIASALVTRAMEVFEAAGMEYAALGVDSENPTGAFHIYESLGFVSDRRNIAYIKKV
ncbi:MAG: GNAT family N-acetyltransferase [Actinomycetota bacterium]